MIESIQIKGVATYDTNAQNMSGLSKFNFVYGSNGSGKTTITRVIADHDAFPTCKVTWLGGTKMQTMVYNRDFIEKNFNQSAELKGVFTLGDKNVETLSQIAAAKDALDVITKEIEKLNHSLQGPDGAGGKKGELAALEEEFKIKCWAQKQKHDAKLSGAFEGLRNNSAKFKGRVLQERASNSASLETLVELERKAETVFGPAPATEPTVSPIEPTKVLAHEANLILKKRVIGKEDVDIAAMIKKLGSSDWVRAGRAFYDANDMTCPFCQQSTTEALAKSLNEYFDVTFVTDSKAIEELVTNYATDSARLQQQLAASIATQSKFLDVEKLKVEKELLDSKITINNQRLSVKKKEPSQVAELESVHNVVSTIKALIDAANAQIAEHNKMVGNISTERSNLIAQVWKYLLEVELKADLESYEAKRDGLRRRLME